MFNFKHKITRYKDFHQQCQASQASSLFGKRKAGSHVPVGARSARLQKIPGVDLAETMNSQVHKETPKRDKIIYDQYRSRGPFLHGFWLFIVKLQKQNKITLIEIRTRASS